MPSFRNISKICLERVIDGSKAIFSCNELKNKEFFEIKQI